MIHQESNSSTVQTKGAVINRLTIKCVQYILNFSMNKAKPQRYIKSFSKGQITVPKEFRDLLGLGDEFWLKLSVEQNKIVAEPVDNEITQQDDYSNKLLAIKGDWFASTELVQNRVEIDRRLETNEQ